MTDTQTLTYWEYRYDTSGPGRIYRTGIKPSEALASRLKDVRRVDLTVKPGDEIEVHAFGAWRYGVVTKLGRTRVRVRYVRNQRGDESERSFAVWEVRPRTR